MEEKWGNTKCHPNSTCWKITWRKLPAPLQDTWIWQGERAFRKHFTDTLSGSVRSRMSMLGTEWKPSLRFLFSLTYFTKDPPGKSRDSDDKVKKKKKKQANNFFQRQVGLHWISTNLLPFKARQSLKQQIILGVRCQFTVLFPTTVALDYSLSVQTTYEFSVIFVFCSGAQVL